MKEEDATELKALKDYALVRGELYHRMPGGVLSRCVGWVEAQRKLKDIHDKTCGSCGEVILYRRLQRAGFYWQTWVKKQTKSKPSAGPANSQQTERKVMLCSTTRTGEAHSYSS